MEQYNNMQMGETAESELTQTEIIVEGKIPDLNRTIESASADESVEHMVLKINKMMKLSQIY